MPINVRGRTVHCASGSILAASIWSPIDLETLCWPTAVCHTDLGGYFAVISIFCAGFAAMAGIGIFAFRPYRWLGVGTLAGCLLGPLTLVYSELVVVNFHPF